MFCPKCGAENPDDAKFCTNCGAKLGVTPAPSRTSRGKARGKAEVKARGKAEVKARGKAEVKAEVKARGRARGKDKSSTGMQLNTAGLLCYLAGWITGIVFVVLEKKSQFVKFHAWQSIMTFGILSVVQIIISPIRAAAWPSPWDPTPSLVLWRFMDVLFVLVWILTVVLWILLMVQAGTGKMWKLPWIGNWAERQAGKGS